jgi:hypothetical protein
MLLFHMLNHPETNLAATEQKALCTENTDVLIALYNGDNSLRYQNPSMAKVMAVENTSFPTLFDQPEVAAQILQILETEQLAEIEQQLRTKLACIGIAFLFVRFEALLSRQMPFLSPQAIQTNGILQDKKRKSLLMKMH